VTRRLLALGACTLLLLTGCVRGTSDDASDSMPERAVPDEVLFQQVTDLPGVATVEGLRFQNAFGYEPQYVGRITAEPDADPLCVLDEALAILHQGREGVRLGVEVTTREKVTYGLSSLVGNGGTAEGRYGPQPTQPQPTATVRACTPPDPGSPLASPTPTS